MAKKKAEAPTRDMVGEGGEFRGTSRMVGTTPKYSRKIETPGGLPAKLPAGASAHANRESGGLDNSRRRAVRERTGKGPGSRAMKIPRTPTSHVPKKSLGADQDRAESFVKRLGGK